MAMPLPSSQSSASVPVVVAAIVAAVVAVGTVVGRIRRTAGRSLVDHIRCIPGYTGHTADNLHSLADLVDLVDPADLAGPAAHTDHTVSSHHILVDHSHRIADSLDQPEMIVHRAGSSATRAESCSCPHCPYLTFVVSVSRDCRLERLPHPPTS